jgi:hypothetical protein
MYSEHTVVCATEKINEIVDKGCLGVIVYIFNNNLYEVEFFDNNKNTISVDTVSNSQIHEVKIVDISGV